jgi:hypothetical protein
LERAAVGIKLDFQRSRVREPDDLLVRANDDNLRKHAHQYELFRHHRAILQWPAKITQHDKDVEWVIFVDSVGFAFRAPFVNVRIPVH